MTHNQFSEFLSTYFIKYTTITSQSDGNVSTLPTTLGQKTMVETLKKDLEHFGVSEIDLQENGILIAKIKGDPSITPLSFMSHVDTTDIGVSPDVKAHIVTFTGEDIVLNKELDIFLKVSDYPEIIKYKGDSIIVTDGTSVLGADNKAGVTAMMGLAKYLSSNDIPHGDAYFIFVPDEEVGLRGAYAFDMNKLPKDLLSYTIDGGPLGEFGYETFNAASATVHIKGVAIHPGSAKGIMVNPILIANDYIAKLDPYDTPEHSEGKEGFILVNNIKGNVSESEIDLIIRDFDKEKFEARKVFLQKIADEIKKMHPRAEIALDISDSYANIANTLTEDRRCIDIVEEAMKDLNIPIQTLPIRGGTDGAVFSVKGLPTPNLFTGGYNFHSIHEFLPLSSFVKILEVIIKMVELAHKYPKS